MIAIIDYGVGNIGSIANMIAKIGGRSRIVTNYQDLNDVSRIILPGVGSFDDGMSKLNLSGLLPALNEKVFGDKIPVLGICLGAQMMTIDSEEGSINGLGWFNANTLKFNFDEAVKKMPLPNIGWRTVRPLGNCPLLKGFNEPPRFYFVHSYYMKPCGLNEDIVSMNTDYGVEYACGLSNDNIHCVQFHPEKSHKYGMQFFKNFQEMS
jgi:glutamine amidotransferase